MFANHQSRQRGKWGDDGLSDSESSLSPSPSSRSRCFCGNQTQDGGIYCSVSCARSDAFSSLCYKPNSQQPEPLNLPSHSQHPSIASAISASLSRNPSSASSTSIASSSSNQDVGDWNASHYRRLAQADLRREERKEERRRRRAEGSLASSISTSRSTMMSVSSSASRSVPELVGGHSRNPSVASSITSMSSSTWGLGGGLSRNPSSASTSSRKGGVLGGNVNIGAAIMEHEDEEEWLQSEFAQPTIPAIPISNLLSTKKPSHSRSGSKSASSRKGRKHTPDPLPFGMGKDMRDVLEEIIQMEKSFLVSDNENEENDDDDSRMLQSGSLPNTTGLFTSQFDRPPRTPSPVSSSKRRGSIAPGAPMRGHRSVLSQSALQQSSPPKVKNPQPQRPPSLMGLHQSSLSESHTALYLATASPIAPGPGRRSASPKLDFRRSITFTPDTAGPSISFDGLPIPSRKMFESPGGNGNITPVGGRRRLNLTPQAVHPSMDGWRFPSGSGTGSNMATPTRPPQNQIPTPDEIPGMESEPIEPTLLWPSHLHLQPPNLQPALFPSSPALIDTPDYPSNNRLSHEGIMNGVKRDSQLSAPGSGMRLGELLGSGTGIDEMAEDEDMEMDAEESNEGSSTEHGHAHLQNHYQQKMMGYLPVYLEAEGFRSGDGSTRRGW
ncbi:uncharacterized protein L201_003285 [Kwoniella dendrophila CBS 6074]|uniref:Uncharacterized protein n=1 Tax=Kwoniella dendrophila CBS 6074 TaxID=1295534 RepID=A0AAX4JU89_9TREE